MLRTWLIGEAPAPSMGGLPAFSSATGQRMTSWLEQDVRDVFHCRNVLHDWPGRSEGGKGSKFPHDDAQIAARNMLQEIEEVRREEEPDGEIRVILVGLRVARAFMVTEPVKYLTWQGWGKATKWRKAQVPQAGEFAVLPHPSGINRWYNDPDNLVAAAKFLKDEMVRMTRGVVNHQNVK